MPIYEVQTPDGKILEIEGPAGATAGQLKAVAASHYRPGAAGSGVVDAVKGLGRAAGLTARGALEGLPAVADIAWNPVRNLVAMAGGPKLGTMEEGGKTVADLLRLPSPQTPDERTVQEGVKLGFGAAGTAGLLQRGAQTAAGGVKTALQALGANPAQQAAVAAGGGLAGQAVKEGGGDPWNQFSASLLGGLAGAGGAKAAESVARGVYTAIAPLIGRASVDVDLVLRNELGRAGVDWDALAAQTKAALREDTRKMFQAGRTADPAALRRLADFRQVPGTTPLLGDVTQDPRLLTIQRNLGKQQANMPGLLGSDDITGATNRNAKAVINALDSVAPSSADKVQTGQGLLGLAQSQDDSLRAAENALYAQARGAAGREIPLARGAFVEQAFANLARENKTAFLPENISTMLNQISKGEVAVGGRVHPVPFNVDTIDQLKTTLATASRATSDGNVKAAIKSVRDALETVQIDPVKAGLGGATATAGQAATLRAADALPQQALDAFDAARSAARGRREWQESAKWITEALDGADPINFVRKHVINGDLDNLRSMRQQIGDNPDLLAAVKKQMVDYIRERGSVDANHTTFTSKGMEDALKSLTDQRLSVFFTPAEIQQLRAIVNVGRHIQAQPIGSAVNNSNTAAVMLGKFSDMLTRGSGVPVLGPMVAAPLQGAATRMQMRRMLDAPSGLLMPEGSPLNPALPMALGASLLLSP